MIDRARVRCVQRIRTLTRNTIEPRFRVTSPPRREDATGSPVKTTVSPAQRVTVVKSDIPASSAVGTPPTPLNCPRCAARARIEDGTCDRSSGGDRPRAVPASVAARFDVELVARNERACRRVTDVGSVLAALAFRLEP